MYITNILDYLDNTAKKLPDKVAFFDSDSGVTFSELQKRAYAIGSLLHREGHKKEAVLVMMKKHPDTVCALMGVISAGCFYVVIDADMPNERILSICARVDARALIYDKASEKKAIILMGRLDPYLYSDAIETDINETALCEIRKEMIDTDPMYVVFTSGSTGEPKGVATSHRAVIDYTEALCSSLDFDESTVFGNQAPFCFDAPLKEIMPALKLGCSVCLIPKNLFSFPLGLCQFIEKMQINTVCWTASSLNLISSSGTLEASPMHTLRLICSGSEILPTAEYQKWRDACGSATFVNLYGPTEATGMSCFWKADRELSEDEPVPIGKPFPNTRILLLNNGKECEKLETGEIYIKGSCLGLGYYNDADESKKGFIQNPMHDSYPDIVYKTGDMAYRNEYGELICIGRGDRQIKHMGYRVELCEIEHAARKAGTTFCRAYYDSENKRIKLCYYGEIGGEELMRGLIERLPRYMMPNDLIRLENIFLTKNGKADIRRIEKEAELICKGSKNGEND